MNWVGLSVYFDVLILVVTVFLGLLTIRSNRIAALMSIIFSVYVVLQVASIYLTGNVVDYRFYSHFNFNAVAGHGFQFVYVIFGLTILFVALATLLYLVSRDIKQKYRVKNVLVFLVMAFLFVIMLAPNGVLSETYKIYEILSVEEKEFNDALSDLGIKSENYTLPEHVSAVEGKNIIVISMESLEKGFLGSDFERITPNLRKLSKELTYYENMPVIPGGGWTAASLYNHQVGMPAFFKGQGNHYFQGTTDVKLTGLGHVLEKADYNSKYIVGNPEFAGMSDILNAYGIAIISEKNSIGNYPKTRLGFHDLDLFNEAKLQVAEAKMLNKPFSIFISTVNTHFPNGIYDKRMEDKVPTIDNDLEFSVSALDYLIGDFIHFLKEEGLFETTAVYIFPDHLLMGNQGEVLDKLRKSNRQLFLITNVKENVLSKSVNETIFQIDLPRIILDGADIKTNADFLTDFIKRKDVVSYVKENRVKLTALNLASLNRRKFNNEISVILSDDELLISSNGDLIKFDVPSDVSSDDGDYVYDVMFTPEMTVIQKERGLKKDVFDTTEFDKKYGYLHLIIFFDNEKIYAYLGDKKKAGISYSAKKSLSFSREEVELVVETAKNISQIERSNLEQELIAESSHVAVTSSEYKTTLQFPSVFNVDGESFGMSRGVNILSVNSGFSYEVENYDTYGSEKDANDFIARVVELKGKNAFFVIASHDAVSNKFQGYKEKLVALGFEKLAALQGRVAYIAYLDKNKNLHEYSSNTTLSRVIATPLSMRVKAENNSFLESSLAISKYGKDVSRFIAHAGGEINGKRYTNSLEALDLNYKLGFRLFELDIVKTSDDKYVAAHDWAHWASIAGYAGELPPDRDVFKKYRLHDKYTPLDIDDINIWFKNHSDAILITDKINDPESFSKEFVSKKRLIMELFSLDAVKKGVDSQIMSAMPSWNVLSEIQGDKIQALKEIGVTRIAVSRRVAHNKKKLLKKLRGANIKLFAYHVNFDKGKDELYVICNEMDYFYGIYADKWDFKKDLDCSRGVR